MMKELFVLAFLLFPAFGFGQDKVLLTNGKEKAGYILYQDNNNIYYGVNPKEKVDEEKLSLIENNYKKLREKIDTNKRKSTLQKSIALQQLKKKEVTAKANVKFKTLKSVVKDNVFSITHADGKEEIIYSPDTLGFLVLDVVEPEIDYTVEEMRRYIYGRQDGMKVKSLTPALISGGVGLVGAGLGAFFGPIAPSTYIVILSATKQKPDEKSVGHPEFVFDEAYLDGYRKSAKKKKIIAATEGGLVGLAVGILAYQTIFRGWK